MCGEEAGGLNSPPAGRGDEKADSWQPRSGAKQQRCPPRTRLGHQWLPAGLRQLRFICLEEGGRTREITPRSPPSPPRAASRPALRSR